MNDITVRIDCPMCAGTGAQDLDSSRHCVQCAGSGKIERTLEQLMWQARRLDDEIKARTAEHITPLQYQLDTIKAALAAAVVEHGETIRTADGRIEYVRASERVSWDSKALEGYAVAHPEILQFRTVKLLDPSARIKFEVS